MASLDAESNVNNAKVHFVEDVNSGNYSLKIFQSMLNVLAHIQIGIVVGACLIFVLRQEIPLGPTQIHIALCVIGYQLLMAEAILSLSPSNGWSANLRLVDKKRAHTILQILGSVLAIVGSFIKIFDKEIHWNTLHGRFGLVALVFTTISLVNGLTSLYAHELRRVLPGSISKITHICFGGVAFFASCLALCYGFDKMFFRSWATEPITNTIIGLTASFTFIIIINPTINFYNKSVRVLQKGK